MSERKSVSPKTALWGGGLAVASAAALAAYQWGVRPWYQRWGATDEELNKPLPGDELVPAPRFTRTKAITIQAPVEQVWPWLVQLGQDKAGLYSYELIENRLLGCDIHNSEQIVPEWQSTQVGDPVRLFPRTSKGRRLTWWPQSSRNRAFVLGHKDENGQWFDTWQFVLEPLAGGKTRLIHRVRGGSMGVWDALQFAYFIMERAMVLGIKERAERLALAQN